jgi:hypothetical protein
MGSPRMGTRTDSRSVHVVVLGLRQALAKANASPTVQEGLYRAYTAHLCDLDPIDDVPQALGTALHELVVDLRRAFGFDETTGAKVAPSTLGRRDAALLLARLGAIASGAETLAEDAERGLPH